MKPTDFAEHLTAFLSEFLPAQKNASRHTISSYRDTFKLMLQYFSEELHITPQKLKMDSLSHERISNFLIWLEEKRDCSISTRNQRLAAIRSFFKYAQYEEPERLAHFQKVIALPSKKAPRVSVPYLSSEGMQALLAQPDKMTSKGRRDLTLLSFLYDSGCRVQELIDLRVRDVVLNQAAVAVLTGKGNKTRRVPLMKNTSALLQRYISENHLDITWKCDYPMFFNSRHSKLTREGVTYIISKYVPEARKAVSGISEKVSPHMFRHSKAMHLLQAGVSLIYIRDILGHEDLKTTEIYAKCDTELKRKAIENAFPDLIDSSNFPDWSKDDSLMDWLSKL